MSQDLQQRKRKAADDDAMIDKSGVNVTPVLHPTPGAYTSTLPPPVQHPTRAPPTIPTSSSTNPSAGQYTSSIQQRGVQGSVQLPNKLSLVVADAVERWFDDAYRGACNGDIKMQALVSQMFLQGYGCQASASNAQHWADMARRRGYEMDGVYDEL